MSVTRSPARPPSGPPVYHPDDLPVYRGGSGGAAPAPSFTPDDVIPTGVWGDWIDYRDSTVLFTDTAGSTNVAAANDLVARANWHKGEVIATQSTSGNRPKWNQSDGIGSELVSIGLLNCTLASDRSYPAGGYCVINISRKHPSLMGSGNEARTGLRVDGAAGTASSTNGTFSGHTGTNDTAANSRVRSGSIVPLGAVALEWVLTATIVSSSNQLRVVMVDSAGISVDTTFGVGTNIGTDTAYRNVSDFILRSLGRYAQKRGSLIMEAVPTDEDLLNLAAYYGVTA